MAYDALHRQIVMFGGRAGNKDLGDTWLWDGKSWTLATPATSPQPRNGATMAYDAARRQVVLFGGYAQSTLTDTWTWDGTNWTQQKPAHSPTPRDATAMAYDATRQQVVLLGGYAASRYLDDTWTWNGKDWTLRQPATAATGRRNHAMAYDAKRQQVVLFGGKRNGPAHLTDTWVWDGSTWTQIKPLNSPVVLAGHSMAYDSSMEQVVMFGVVDGPVRTTETWSWSGKNWIRQNPPATPPHRSSAQMAYDSANKETVLFGGYGFQYLAETWTWGPHPYASVSSYGVPCGTFPGVYLGASPNSLPGLGEKLTLEIRGLPAAATGGLLTLGLSRTRFGTAPLPLDLSPLGMKGCHLYNSFDFQYLFQISASLGSLTLPIPYRPALSGNKLYAQAFGLDPMANKLGLVASNGLELAFGHR
mgnify:CR=1 FL=1